MQQPIYSAEGEQMLMSYLWADNLANNLEAYVMYVYPWGKQGTPLANFSGPRKWQRKVLRKITKHIADNKGQIDMRMLMEAIASGRGIGKSALVAWLIHWMLTTRIGSTVIVSANSENQLKTVTWGELIKWVTMSINSHWWEPTATKLVPAAWLTSLVERDLKIGTRYWGAEGKLWSEENPDSYAGAHNYLGMMVIFDEASGIPDAIWSVAKGFFTENTANRFWLAFSNPRRNQGYFFECFNAKRAFWGNMQIDARTVEDTDKSVYEQIIDEYGKDSDEACVEVYGQFPMEGDDHFISPILVDEAVKRDEPIDTSEGIVMGIDPGSGRPDACCVYIRQGRHRLGIKRYKEEDSMVLVGLIVDDILEYDPDTIVIDMGGLGWAVHGRLREIGYNVQGVNFAWNAKNRIKWGNKRAELWGDMKDWLKYACLPEDKAFKSDVIGPKKKPNSKGIMYLESKKDMKSRGLSSPDSGDACACTFAFPVPKRDPNRESRKYKTPKAQRHYDVATSWMAS